MNKLLKVIIPLLVVLAGAAIMIILLRTRSEPRKEVAQEPGILVTTINAVRQDKEIIVSGTGTVKASQEVSVIPQVSGRVTYMSPGLVVGGYFKKDDILFEIEAVDYVLALEQAKAAKAKAEYDLATIEGRARIARSEWDNLKMEDDAQPNPLVLYEPQMQNARAALASADAAVEQAKLALERTRVKAPFNSKVSSENIDIGQYLSPGGSVAVLTGTETVEINVPLISEDLHWLDLPPHGRDLNGPEAVISVNVGSQAYDWSGRILRTTGEVDPKTRMTQVVIEVIDPYGLSDQDGSRRPPLAIGTFVHVKIKGRKLHDVYVIPRTTLRDNSTVWLMGGDNKLIIRAVAAVRIKDETVVVNKGLESGDKIIVTNISGAANGMKLRTPLRITSGNQ